MNFKRRDTSNYLFADTSLENLFISEYMAKAPGEYIKVYLYALMCAENGLECSNALLASRLSIPETAVEGAWEYWEEKALVKRLRVYPGKSDLYDIEFVNQKDELFGLGSAVHKEPEHIVLGNKQLSDLYRNVEAVTGRMLASGELEGISGLVMEYGISPEMIVYGYKYCNESGKSNKFRYVAAVLKDWKAKDLTSIADVEDYLSGIDSRYSDYRKIFKELGFNRNPSEPEKRMMDRWLNEFNIPMDEILSACAKTTGISSPNLNYINVILSAEKNLEKDNLSEESLLAKVETLYAQARERNEQEYQKRIAEIYTIFPRVRDIADEIRDANYKIAKSVFKGAEGKRIAAEERSRVALLLEEKSRILVSGGYSADATDMKYDCPDCKDTGLTEDGTRCHCYGEKLAAIQKK